MVHRGEFAVQKLWGGAVEAEISSSFVDMSDLRQVPDHQECWLDERGRLLVFEILEHQAFVEDSSAARYFFQDLAQANGANDASASSFSTYGSPGSTFSRALAPAVTAQVCLGAGQQRVRMGRDFDLRGIPVEGQEERKIKVEVAAVRIPQLKTDVLITLSTPVLRSGDPKDGTTSEILPSVLLRRAVESFSIIDLKLFQSP
jgi:hypothetical protein